MNKRISEDELEQVISGIITPLREAIEQVEDLSRMMDAPELKEKVEDLSIDEALEGLRTWLEWNFGVGPFHWEVDIIPDESEDGDWMDMLKISICRDDGEEFNSGQVNPDKACEEILLHLAGGVHDAASDKLDEEFDDSCETIRDEASGEGGIESYLSGIKEDLDVIRDWLEFHSGCGPFHWEVYISNGDEGDGETIDIVRCHDNKMDVRKGGSLPVDNVCRQFIRQLSCYVSESMNDYLDEKLDGCCKAIQEKYCS